MGERSYDKLSPGQPNKWRENCICPLIMFSLTLWCGPDNVHWYNLLKIPLAIFSEFTLILYWLLSEKPSFFKSCIDVIPIPRLLRNKTIISIISGDADLGLFSQRNIAIWLSFHKVLNGVYLYLVAICFSLTINFSLLFLKTTFTEGHPLVTWHK